MWTGPFCAEGSLGGAFSRSLTRRVRRRMLLLVRLGAAITESLDHTNAPRRKGVWQRAATDTNAHRLSVVRGSSRSLKLIQVLPYGRTVVLLRNADSLIKHQQTGIFLAETLTHFLQANTPLVTFVRTSNTLKTITHLK